ncbi:hypothetical protein SP5_110_00060 [Sphingomonas parapaucimobilis NBRC 15100]|uniref:Uncharacterized protein n=1 Tax=Sphingomonas parapaucimobilis NBRC 15100 TaxID=1219049 RepID=A0A0A1WC83_9SPHN|nr:hypothetical protein SP5_110_00060 [Sphingomonas parapaucimobilis NBRC 15100]
MLRSPTDTKNLGACPRTSVGIPVTVRFLADWRAALDAWIASQSPPPNRSEETSLIVVARLAADA